MSERASAYPPSFEYVEGWGMVEGHHSRVLRPASVEEVQDDLEGARKARVSLALRGAGCSYGDPSITRDGHVLDLTRLNRILAFDDESGVVEVESGVTLEQIWKHILPRGWWPKVCSGTMFPTTGGALGMNIHGKNNFRVGTWGDNTLELDIVLPSGELETCSREQNSELFHAAIGGFGMLGAICRAKLQTTRIHSGEIDVVGISTHNLGEMMERMDAQCSSADYLVGWIDCFASGDCLGRGLVHAAHYLAPGVDPEPEQTLTVAHQELPGSIMGFPKAQLWRALYLFNHDPGMRMVNAAKYMAGRLEGMAEPYRQSHAGFNFLLDYVPNWKWAYGRHGRRGLIQYQSFLPADVAERVYAELLTLCQRRSFNPYLGVLKRHKPDPFWLTHALDGWSLALDFKVTPKNRAALFGHCEEMTTIVLAAGGKFYFAKDQVLGLGDPQRFLSTERLEAFKALKRSLDPGNLFQSEMSRRLFGNSFLS
ncbi:MAG: FAD-binding oxidoreductase [bacterium]|jgi:FAD/FMN-containing dehydrogenase